MGLLDDMKTLIPTDVADASSIFLGSYPDTPDNIVTLYHSGGSDPSHSFGSREFENPSFQVRIRNASYAIAHDKANQVKDAYDGQTELTIDGNRYLSIFQQGDILPLGRDEQNRTELSLNFRVRVQRA
jgi:hypothetical protein